MGYDSVITLLGDFGKYQTRIYLLLCLPAISCALHKLAAVFLVAEPKNRCRLPFEYGNETYDMPKEVFDKWIPKIYNSTDKYSSCQMFVQNETVKCSEYIFDDSVYGYTTVTEWQLTCDNAYMIAIGNSLFMLGVMLGSIIFGELSDRYGRKIIFFISLILQVVFGVLAAISPEFWTFTFARLIVGATTSGVFLVAYVIALEMVGPAYRPAAGTIMQIFFSGGYMLTAVFAIYIHNWRHLQLALTLPGLAFFCYWWFIPESARWLITKNRIPEAKQLIQKAAKVNKVTITDEQLNDLLIDSKTEEKDDVNVEKKTATILDIFKYPNLRKKALIIFFDWFANNITYYGLSWNTNNLAGNPYMNFIISGAVEIPAYIFLMLTLNRWGRKLIMCGCMIVAGTALLLTIVVPIDLIWMQVTLAMLGKLAITASYGAVYIFSTEQFPTVIRNAGLGAGSTSARIGSIVAPFVNGLAKLWNPFPLIIFGIIALIGGIMSLVLPETLNKKLPETIEEGEAFGLKSSKRNIEENKNTIVEMEKLTNGKTDSIDRKSVV